MQSSPQDARWSSKRRLRASRSVSAHPMCGSPPATHPEDFVLVALSRNNLKRIVSSRRSPPVRWRITPFSRALRFYPDHANFVGFVNTAQSWTRSRRDGYLPACAARPARPAADP